MLSCSPFEYCAVLVQVIELSLWVRRIRHGAFMFSLIIWFKIRCHTVIIPAIFKAISQARVLCIHRVELSSLTNVQYIVFSIIFSLHSVHSTTFILDACFNIGFYFFSSNAVRLLMSIARVNRANLTYSRREKVSCR